MSGCSRPVVADVYRGRNPRRRLYKTRHSQIDRETREGIMPWLKVLHILALVIWCATLLYLPVLIAASGARAGDTAHAEHPLARKLFTTLATPVALLAIISGTTLFLWHATLAPWLLLKLAAVSAMVLCHALCGVLIVRVETKPEASVGLPCALVGLTTLALILVILGLVLGKPTLGEF